MDKDGTLLQANRRLLDYLGLALEQMKDSGTQERIRRNVHPEDLERFEKGLSAGLSKRRPFEMEKRLRGKDGQYRWFLVRCNPLLNENGDVVRWFGTATDIEDHKQAENRLRNENVALREEIERSSMFEEIAGSSQALLLPYGAVSVFPATLKEAVTHHAVAEQKKDNHQNNYQEELPNSEGRRLSSGRSRLIHLPFLRETFMKLHQ
jgi:PAS domain S-box-containing protein